MGDLGFGLANEVVPGFQVCRDLLFKLFESSRIPRRAERFGCFHT